MGEGKGSTLVHVLVVVLSLVAFGFAIAAERRRSTVSIFFTFHFQVLNFLSCDSNWGSFNFYFSRFLSKLIAFFYFSFPVCFMFFFLRFVNWMIKICVFIALILGFFVILL
jgi:hypothetical protein